jgi:hypothetical protein
MHTLDMARHSMALAERDHRAGILDDFQYADVRSMLTQAIEKFERESVKRTTGAGALKFTQP